MADENNNINTETDMGTNNQVIGDEQPVQPAPQSGGLTDEAVMEQSEQILDDFVRKMIDDKNQQNASVTSAEEYATECDKLKEQLIIQINARILDALPKDKLKRFDAGMEDGTLTTEEVNTAVANANLDLADIAKRTAEDFRTAYLADTLEMVER